jgi:hypothetical protein
MTRTVGVRSALIPVIAFARWPFPRRTAVATVASRPTVSTCATVSACAPVAPCPSIADCPALRPVAPAGAAADQLGRDPGRIASGRTDQLDPLRFPTVVGLGWSDRRDGDAIDFELSLGPDDITGLGALVEKRPFDQAAWFLGAGSAPRPASVRSRACELDVDSPGHEQQTLSESG